VSIKGPTIPKSILHTTLFILMIDTIKVRGAREHNLKNVDLDIPKNKLVVFTGVSGSGKSSLAMDTIYAEGQRRYVESLSSYARQFLGRMDKPDVDSIEGLSPAIAIDQKTVSHNPRSTVGTVTEVYDYMRLLFARIGHPHCPNCGREIAQLSVDQIVDGIIQLSHTHSDNKKKGTRVMILAPIVRDRKGEFIKLFANLKREGFTRIRLDGQIRSLEEDFVLIKTNRHSIEALVDRVVIEKTVDAKQKTRLSQSIETALKLADGYVISSIVTDKSFDFPESPQEMDDHLFSERFSCPICNISLPEIEPRTFSFNSPHGACPECAGLGLLPKITLNLLHNPRLSVAEGGIFPWSNIAEKKNWRYKILEAMSLERGVDLNKPIAELTDKQQKDLFYGTGSETYSIKYRNKAGIYRSHQVKYEGVIPHLQRRYSETDSDYIRNEIEKYMIKEPCSECGGKRLKQEALGITIDGRSIFDVADTSIRETHRWLKDFFERNKLKLNEREKQVSTPIIKEISSRLEFLLAVGLDYLSLTRTASTLAGGEAQRIRLASQIGSGLSGVLYVLDEPSIGLHDRDQNRLIDTLLHLRDLGNSVIVVEHDTQTIQAADYLVDFGPGAGKHGGKVIAEGTVGEVSKNKQSITGDYLSGRKVVKVEEHLEGSSEDRGALTVVGARGHNLKNIDVTIPLGRFIAVAGVSGSGKSTLINETLYAALRQEFGLKIDENPQDHDGILGMENISNVIAIDQSPIGRTPRSNPATYTKAFDGIRDLFATSNESKMRGYTPGRFSFNVKGGRCEVCQGDGQLKIEMQFLPDVYVDCEVCSGKRYNRETLEVDYKGKNIHEVLEMTIEEALGFFQNIPKIEIKLRTLNEVGLGYLTLGQSAPTLSGGEAQRIKLASELSKRSTGSTLYILDEPTTGLHYADLQNLLNVLKLLVKKGNTVLVIEHNLDIIKNADYVIDLGPDGGDRGGGLVFAGSVDELLKSKESYTAESLRRILPQE
jgi:excinuclease ABC subunit A